MGLFKRLFSIGSKKNKKDRPPIVHNVPVPELPWVASSSGAAPAAVNEEEHEAAVGKLLRSSSARFAQSYELDYATLPPLPHPINNVIKPPASSAVSLASSTISQQSTYNVTVHKRRRHTPIEAPLPHTDIAKSSANNIKRSSLHEDDSRVLRLRSDPSVASLLELYDEHGKVAADAFSNDTPTRALEPPKEGRAQVRRNGSTLRQLLGGSSNYSAHDGDESESGEGEISWAERFLAESEATTSSTSLVLQTPITPKFSTMPLKTDTSMITDGDISVGTIDNPAISSMEVEVSVDFLEDLEDVLDKKGGNPYMHFNPSTPQRASQVFDFLTRKQSTTAANLDRTLPDLPSCFSSPSDENGNLNFHFNDPPAFTFAPVRGPSQLPSVAEYASKPARTRPDSIALERAPSVINYRDTYGGPQSTFSDDSHSAHYAPPSVYVHQNPPEIPDAQATKTNDIKVIMTGPTKVIVTAPTPSAAHDNMPMRMPRGPRALPNKSSGSVKRRRSALVELSNASSTSVSDPSKVISGPKRQQPANRRSSQSSVSSQTREDRPSSRTRHHRQDIVSPAAGQYKENQLGLSVKTELPSTPMRSNSHASGSRALLRTVVQQAMFNPPASPASSSEMSPVGRQMMVDVRQQRIYAREADRERVSKRARAERPQRV